MPGSSKDGGVFGKSAIKLDKKLPYLLSYLFQFIKSFARTLTNIESIYDVISFEISKATQYVL